MKSKIIDLKLTPQERSFVIPITMSGMFQWFEFFLFIYWSKIFEPEAQFADFFGPLTELGYVILLFIIHLFSRPIGGIIFGFIGDKFDRPCSGNGEDLKHQRGAAGYLSPKTSSSPERAQSNPGTIFWFFWRDWACFLLGVLRPYD